MTKKDSTTQFLESEAGAQLIQAVKSLSEGIKGLEQFFSAYSLKGDEVANAANSESEGKKRKIKKRVRDPDAPKAPLSSYLLFTRDQRALIKEQYPDMEPKALMQEIGRRWREEATPEVKEKYNSEATVLRDQYLIEKAEFSKSKQEDIPLPPGSDSDSSDSTESEVDTKKQKVEPPKPATFSQKTSVPKPKPKVEPKSPEKAALPSTPSDKKKRKKKAKTVPSSPELVSNPPASVNEVKSNESPKKKAKKEKV